MKIEGMIRILMVLLSKDMVTADELSEKLEMSKRSIYRYIDALDLAGIPVVSFRGKHGGYQIISRFRLSSMYFTQEEYNTLINALASAHISNMEKSALMDKLISLSRANTVNTAQLTKDSIIIDCNNNISENYETIQSAIINLCCVSFVYTDNNMVVTNRVVNPYFLLFKNDMWYLVGDCHEKGFRTFKLQSISLLKKRTDTFTKKEFYYETRLSMRNVKANSNTVELTIVIQKEYVDMVKHMIKNITPCGDKFLGYSIVPYNNSLIQKLAIIPNVDILSPKSVKDKVDEYIQELKN